MKCGGRCIPPTWDCRLKGEGTNAELKVHSQDISAGIASVQRGGVDVAKGFVSLNPARVERGRRSLIRGAVKIAPGDNLEKKKQLRKKLEQNTNVIAGAVAIGLAASGGYMVGRKLVPPKWRTKWEGPAVSAFNQVLDAAPVIGGNRARQRQAGQMAATSLGGAITKGVKMQAVGQKAAGNVGGVGPLAFRTRSANTVGAGLGEKLGSIDASKRSFEDWKQESTQALFGAKVNGHSIFSDRATNEYLVSQYNLQSSRKVGAVARGTGLSGGTQAERNTNVKNALAAKLQTMGEDMKADAKLRGFPDTEVGRNRYIKEVALPGVERGLGKMSAMQKQNALKDASDLITSSWTKEGATRRAKLIHASTVENYDTYFGKVAANVQRFSGNPVNKDSPLGDANTALARYTIGRQTGTSPQIRSRNHADLLLREHYHTNVMGQRSGYIVSESRAKSIAKQITRSTTTPTTEQAFKTLNANGFPYARSGKNATPTASKAPAPKTGLRAQQNLAALAKKIMAREGNSGMSYAAALRAARAEQKRRDSARGDDEHMSPTITKRNPPEPLVTNSTPTVVNGPTSTEHLPKDEDEMVTPLMPVSKMSESPSPKEAEQQGQGDAPKPEGTIKLNLNLELPASAVMGKVMQDSMPPRIAAYLQTREDLLGKSQGTGKKCGNSHIPRSHTCNIGRAKAKKTAKTVATAAAVAGVVAGAAAFSNSPKAQQAVRVNAKLITKGSNKRVRGALMIGGRGVVKGLSSDQVKNGLNKLPEGMQGQARKLVGGAKQAAAGMALRSEGYKVQDIDVANNFSTWKDKRGTMISIGSYGDSLVTYASDPSHKWKGKQVYIVGFNVDQSYDAQRTMPRAQSSALMNGVKKMNENHLAKVGDGILATTPWDGDGQEMQKKRRAVYKRIGYNNIINEQSQWALVEKGKIKKMKEGEAFVYLAESGEADAPMYKPRKRRDGFMELKHGAA